jgi:galactokinase
MLKPAELERFEALARNMRGDFFDARRPITLAQAPGWLDLIGGTAAYGGSLALGWPLAPRSFAALQPDPEPLIRIRVGADEYTLALHELVIEGEPRSYADATERITAHAPKEAVWWQIVLGAWPALMREEFVRFPGGARLLLQPGSGPGLIASLSAAVTQALVSAYAVRIAARELALACRTAIEHVGGLNHSALGPMICVRGNAGSLLALHQQPAWDWGDTRLPHGAAIWAIQIDDGTPLNTPSVPTCAGSMAYDLLANALYDDPAAADADWRGYLANIGDATFRRGMINLLPDRLTGAAFLQRYGTPERTRMIDPYERYPLRAAAALSIDEHMRTRLALALLRAAANRAQREDDLQLVGELMVRSHWDQRTLGLGSGNPHADALVDRIYAAGPPQGLLGARATTAESGANLVVLGRPEAEPVLRNLVDTYAATCSTPLRIRSGNAAGCSPSGTYEI